MAPEVIKPVTQVTEGDCAICSLAMMLGVPYEQVGEAAKHITRRNPHRGGLTTGEIIKIAHKLSGHDVESLLPSQVNLSDETGILAVRYGKSEHAVALFEGVIYNPADGLIYSIDAYLASMHAKPIRFIRF